MKHLLNNLTEEEKNTIREQHEGGMEVMNENFHKMVNKELGHVNLYEQELDPEVGTYSGCLNQFSKKSGLRNISRECKKLLDSEKLDKNTIEACKATTIKGYGYSYRNGHFDRLPHFHELIMCMNTK